MEGSFATQEEMNELKELVHHTLYMVEENNKILHNMRRWGRVAFVAKVIIWSIVLISPFFLYQYVAPSGNSLFGLPSPEQIQKIFQPSK